MEHSKSQRESADPHPDEGYLDDDFARFRTARLRARAAGPVAPSTPTPTESESDPNQGSDGMFFGTTSTQRRAATSRLREARESGKFDRSEVLAKTKGRRAPPPPLPGRPRRPRPRPDPERSPPHGVDIRKLRGRPRRAS